MPGHEKTRHSEFSLILPVAALTVLTFFGDQTALLPVIGINLLALVAILSSAFSVVRHADVLATISLTVPAVSIIATLTGQTLIFGLEPPHMVMLIAVLILCHISFSTGRTNVLNGAAHLALFAGYLLTIML